MLLSVTTGMDGYIQFVTVLILFVFVLGITYLVTKWIANYQKGKTIVGNLEVIETCRITSNKFVQIVRAGSKYLVIGLGKDEIHILSELSEEELDLQDSHEEKTASFRSIFDEVKRLKEKEKD
ncbi:MAG: flagellar biosynthetic protein FliO [Lachnospiraceae bacterium]|jgi:flagellar protein FliO/FliZ|nr:hypothetical protein C819_03903 [Lachnospiraceae bacterium 10-1]MCX4351792.1 flagellar biosynthetic protein FliO [Lachnospiraceae bacterium]